MTHILTTDFFQQDTQQVAHDLLGKFLVTKRNGQKISLLLTEVEAYLGPHDLACHGRFGKTKRNEAMFMPGGHFYIYMIYGMYWMLNIVTEQKDFPSAILIRGSKEISGPGRLTKFLEIDKSFDKKPAHPSAGLWFEERGIKFSKNQILKTPRIGIDYAGPIWTKKLLRFTLK
jgi:DNA-3-methyladenine glycosylase